MSLGEWHVWHGHRDGMVQRLKDERTGRIRESSNKPYLICFGISTGSELEAKRRFADSFVQAISRRGMRVS